MHGRALFTALLLLSLFSSFGGVRADLKEYPENVAVIQGQTVILKCTANRPNPQSRIMWTEFATNRFGSIISDNRDIVRNHPNSARYSIVGNETENELYLRIVNVTVADGGIYLCQDINSGSPAVFRRYAELIVFASQQVCTPIIQQGDLLEGSSYTTHCQVNYRSYNIVPEMEWSGPDGTYQSNKTAANSSLSSYMTFVAHRALEGETFQCKIRFISLAPVESNYANNVPAYEDTYSILAVDIRSPPENITISPLLSEYNVGDELTCRADSSTEATYSWIRRWNGALFEPAVTSGSKFVIKQDMAGYNMTLRCEASTRINVSLFTINHTISVNVIGIRTSFTEYPENVAVTQGGTVILKCAANRPVPQVRIMWIEFVTSILGNIISDNRDIVPNHPNSARYSILGNATENEFHLRIENVTVADGGRYVCQDVNSGSAAVYRRSAELIVFASQQVCTPIIQQGDLLEGVSYTTHCQVNYRSAAIFPEMEWSGPDGYYQANKTITNSSLSSYMSFVADRSFEGRTFQCRTHFGAGFQGQPDAADNVPDYEDTYSILAVGIWWLPGNITISPLVSEYSVGDELTCWADFDPAATYSWIRRWNGVPFEPAGTSGNTFVIKQDMAGYNMTLRCEASTRINGSLFAINHTISVNVIGVRSSFTEYPENVAVTQGGIVILKCAAKRPIPQARIMWTEFATSILGSVISDNRGIAPTHPNSARYSIVGNATENEFYLRIENVTVADGGRYLCQDVNNGSPAVHRRFAELVVFASQQVCTPLTPQGAPLEGDLYTTHCQVNYRSATIVPDMEWSGPDGIYQSNKTTTNSIVSSYMSFTAHRSLEEMTFQCSISWSTGLPVERDHADNVPSYIDTYSMVVVGIRWPPRNITISPLLSEYNVGDELTCWADSNPAATYNWIRRWNGALFEPAVTSGSKFVIKQDMAGYNMTLQCLTQNLINGFVYWTDLTIYTNVIETPSVSTITTSSASTGVTSSTTLLSSTSTSTTSSMKATSVESISTSGVATPYPTSSSAVPSTESIITSSTTPIRSPPSTESMKTSNNPTAPITTPHWPSERPPQHESVVFHSWYFVGGILLGVVVCLMGLLGYKLLSAARRRRAPPYVKSFKDGDVVNDQK